MSGDRDDRELIERLRRGDREAQHEAYIHTSERVYRLLLRMTRNAHDASDLTQETYLRAFARIGQFDGRCALGTWLYRIAVNEALQLLRRSTRNVVCRPESPGDSPDPAPHSDRSVVRMDVEEALAALPDDDRAILLLRHHEGLDYAAIAEVMDCPQGTVASRLNRARARLRQFLGPAYGAVEGNGDIRHPRGGRSSVCREAPPRDSVRARRPGTGSR